MTDITPEQQAARIRAAIAYSGKDRAQIVDELGISEPTLWRRSNAQRPTGAKSMDELYEIADVCGIPRSFMEMGFDDAIDRRDGQATRLDHLERRLETLTTIVEERLATLAEQELASTVAPGASGSRRAAR